MKTIKREIEIVTFPDRVLVQQARPVERFNGSLRLLCRQMIGLLNTANGVGLAAPQVGVQLRLFVVRIPDKKPQAFINPEIVRVSSEAGMYEEGCLSIPGIYTQVKRPLEVRVQALNERGRPFTLIADGLLARVIQHEHDHLDGILFWDHFSNRRRQKLMQEYESVQESAAREAGKIETNQRVEG